MAWHTKEMSKTNLLIMSEVCVIGSIMNIAGLWHVEILFGGPLGDLKFEASEYASCLAYIEGVKAVVDRLPTIL